MKFFIVAILVLLSGCTTMQTTYFNLSYKPLGNTGTLGSSAAPESRMVNDMRQAAKQMYGDGYAMLGYSQFVSPLFPDLAPGYAAKYAGVIGAEVALLTPPVPGESNLHAYLVTYWAPYQAENYAFGAWLTDLPEELLERLGDQFNVASILQTIHDSNAAKSGFLADDVLLAVDGVRVTDVAEFNRLIGEQKGREVIVSVSRQGELLELPVKLETSGTASGAPSFQRAPWENTAPTDWSSLSAANVVANFQAQQKRQAELDEAYRQGQLAAQQYSNSYSSSSVDSVGSSSLDSRSQRRRGEYQEFSQSYNSDGVRQYLQEQGARNWNAQDWTVNAPKTYNYLFQYPAFVQ